MPSDTPQHAIRDGEFRLIYVSGNKGLYKHFPDTGQILMFKSAGAGNQGHQAGYAGYGGPPKGILEVLITNYNRTISDPITPIGYRHVPSVGWQPFGDPTVGVGVPRWTSIASNKFNPDELLVLGHEPYGLNVSPARVVGHGPGLQLMCGPTIDQAKIWYSPDCGDTWVPFTNVTLNMPTTLEPEAGQPFVNIRIHKIQWDHIVDGRWAAMGKVESMYVDSGYTHSANALALIVGDRTGTAHMWCRPFPNALINNSVWGPPNWPYFGMMGMGWSWVDPDPETGFHKIVFGATVNAGSLYQHVMAETSIPGPTGTSWTPAYTVNVDPDGVHGGEGIGSSGFDPLDHHRGTMEVYHTMSNSLNTREPYSTWQIGGQILWQQNYMEPTPGFNNNHWDFFIPGVELGSTIAAADDAIYIGGRYGGSQGVGGLVRFAYGSTTYDQHTIVPGTEGHTIGGVGADAQHKKYILALDGSGFYSAGNYFVFDGETWGYLETTGDSKYMVVGGQTIINRTPLE